MEKKNYKENVLTRVFSALAFKIMMTLLLAPWLLLEYIQECSKWCTVENTVKEKKERIGRMLQMHANSREDIKEARTGDIVQFVVLNL